MALLLLLLLISSITLCLYYFIISPLFLAPLSKIPGPKLYALTKWRLALDEWNSKRTSTINALHHKYGPVVRIGPNEIHFNSMTALRSIYGAGSGYGRTNFYRMFDVYGRENMFTFHSSKQHADRKKMLANAYSKSAMMKSAHSRMVEEKVSQYLDFVGARKGKPDEIFTSLHYFSIDTISHFVYGHEFGATSAMLGKKLHRGLLVDILDPSRRRLSWCVIHLTALTKWTYTRVGLLESVLRPFLPMQKPATYSGIRDHALKAWQSFKTAAAATSDTDDWNNESTIMSLLFKHHVSQGGSLDDLDIASECADHLLAGVDTTADTLMFLIWALALPKNRQYQEKLIEELRSAPDEIFDEKGIASVEKADKLVYVNAVIKETLRLYAPLPATEPRSVSIDSVIDGYVVPGNTVVGMAPYSLHRNDRVFPHPLVFNPDRWLDPQADTTEMNRWFWGFSSGGRMCIGMHLAMAEMTTLVASIYRKYTTSIAPGFEDCTPAITSRFELFYDEKMLSMKVCDCPGADRYTDCG